MNIPADKILYGSLIGAAVLLTRIPYVGKFFRLIDTLIHESAHALMALIFSGSVDRIDLFANTEGQAVTRSKGKFAWIMISLAGYIGSSLVSFVLFLLLSRGYFDAALYFFIGVCVVNLLLWVRNGYGIFFLLLFGSLCALTAYTQLPLLTKCVTILFCALLWMDALISSAIVLYLSVAQTKNSGDAWSLKQTTKIPAFLWGLLFFVQALFFSYLTLAIYFPVPLPQWLNFIKI